LLGVAGFYEARLLFAACFMKFLNDPITLVSAVAAVLLIALAATLVAESGALRVDPAIVLRDE